MFARCNGWLRLGKLGLLLGLFTLFARHARSQDEAKLEAKAKKALVKAPAAEAGKGGATTILDLQESASTQVLEFDADGSARLLSNNATAEVDPKKGRAVLVSLNDHVNAWYVLKLRWPEGKKEYVFNLENSDPSRYRLALEASFAHGVIFNGKDKFACDIWSKEGKEKLKASIISTSAFIPLCGGRMYVRHKVDGRKTSKEWVSEFLRDNVWGGEQITTFVKEKFFKDSFLIKSEDALDGSEASVGGSDTAQAATAGKESRMPLPAEIDERFKAQMLDPVALGITVEFESGRKMTVGHWYESKYTPGTFVSVIAPNRISQKILNDNKALVAKLDNIEADALAYLVAFDLSQFDLAFAMGTDHPRVDWSPRTLPSVRDYKKAGPDGINSWEPLITTGMINPALGRRVVATFTGGFKRDHSAFKTGKLSNVNAGSHYGVVDNGVLFSRLNPGLATLAVMADGSVDMRTWTEADKDHVTDVRYARQNGVAIIDYDESTKQSLPGSLVKSWGAGNWSGSEDSRFRTLRAGTCLQRIDGRDYLIYGYFSSVTPSAMARVFQAYGCRYAMHLDMNALEHTYLALYQREGKSVKVEHLIRGMEVLDKEYNKNRIPRFVGFPDNRDFFYLTRKKKQDEDTK